MSLTQPVADFCLAGEALGGGVAEVGEDDQHLDPQLLPVSAEEGGVLRSVGAY